MKNYKLFLKTSIASILLVCLSGSSLFAGDYIYFYFEEYARFTVNQNLDIKLGKTIQLHETLKIGVNPENGNISIAKLNLVETNREAYTTIDNAKEILLTFNHKKCSSINFRTSTGETIMLLSNAQIYIFDKNSNRKGTLYQCAIFDSENIIDYFIGLLANKGKEEETENKYTKAFDILQETFSSNNQYNIQRQDI